jgi:hypothetical protein
MAGLDPAIHENTESCNQVNDSWVNWRWLANGAGAGWMAGSSPAMTQTFPVSLNYADRWTHA